MKSETVWWLNLTGPDLNTHRFYNRFADLHLNNNNCLASIFLPAALCLWA